MYAFAQVIGHEHIVAQMQSLLMGRVGHAYLLDGEKGIGKKTLAGAFAKTLQCEAGGNDACGVCLSCRVFESGNHPDVVYVKGTKTKSIGIDDVREQILRPMTVKPFRYRYKIFIVPEAETLTPAAQNALLKTMEEPAPYGIFILLTAQAHAMLPTVLSRCTVYKLAPLTDGQTLKALQQAGITGDTARCCASFARGNIGQALNLAASADFAALRALSRSLMAGIRKADLADTLAWYRRFEPWKDSVQLLLDMLYIGYRDLIVYKGTGDAARLTLPEDTDALDALAGDWPMKALFQSVDALARAKQNLRHNGNFQLTVELLLLRLNGAVS